MIGFFLRAFTFGVAGGTSLPALLLGALLSLCAGVMFCKCVDCSISSCSCIRRFRRACGVDKFDDFEMTMLVHQASFTAKDSKINTCVRVIAGSQKVQTEESKSHIYQQPLPVFVGQGTTHVVVDLMDSRRRKVLASLKLDVMGDILEPREHSVEKLYSMRPKAKGVLTPRIKLTIHPQQNDVEKSLISSHSMTGTETETLVQLQLAKVKAEIEEKTESGSLSETQLLMKACEGPLGMFKNWMHKESVHIAIRGPPQFRKHLLCIWKDHHESVKGHRAEVEIDLTKVTTVNADPGRPDVFVIHFIDAEKVKQKLIFRRIDRARDVWVELLKLLIKRIRKLKAAKRAHQDQKRSAAKYMPPSSPISL